ncbi:MgtC/SapB family protein [Zhaonella formicivorans]|uniref:MgtC/SapB family protein n=1 Tax=Zhaonella formicivorans TaxID=2528593 RepID=UPI0010EF759F|nr:MgtC/SapB family protein [Zhaonella formicivorans]
MTISYLDMLGRLILATILGGIIGYERESSHHYAGLRTHMLVSVSAALIGLGSIILFNQYKHMTTMDPLRVGAQVISGIGFLGAGAILKTGSTIRGLTTAASLWGVAAIGLFTGLGIVIPTLMATLIIYLSLDLAKYTDHLVQKKAFLSIDIFAEDVIGQIGEIGSILFNHGVSIKKINIENLDGNEIIIHLLVEAPHLESVGSLTKELQKASGVKSINIE